MSQLDGSVAVDAGNRRAPSEVVVQERLDDMRAKGLPLVEDIVGDSEVLAGPPRIVAVLGRAAPTDLSIALGVPQMQRHADQVVALLVQQRRGDGGVDASTHRDEDSLGVGHLGH